MEVPYSAYSVLSIVEGFLVFLLAVSVIVKKKRLSLIVIGSKIVIHAITIYDIWFTITHPLIRITFDLFFPMAVRHGISIIILLVIFWFQIKEKYKNAFLSMLILLCLDIWSIFHYYPMFIDYFMNHCENCTKNIAEISHLTLFPSKSPILIMAEKRAFLLLMWTSSAPFNSGSVRILITLIESILFWIQYQKYKKVKTIY